MASISSFTWQKLSHFDNQSIGFVLSILLPTAILPLRLMLKCRVVSSSPPQNRAVHQDTSWKSRSWRFATRLLKNMAGNPRAAMHALLMNKNLLARTTGNLDKPTRRCVDLFHSNTLKNWHNYICWHKPEIAARADREIQLTDGELYDWATWYVHARAHKLRSKRFYLAHHCRSDYFLDISASFLVTTG